MAKKIIMAPGKFSRWALRLISAGITFVFAVFMSVTAQAQQIPGKQSQGKAKSTLSGTNLISVTLDSLPSVIPAYGVVVMYGPCLASFSVKGFIRSEAGNAIPNCKVVVRDTAAKRGIDSTFSGQDGSFSFINESTFCGISTWILNAIDTSRVFNDKDTLFSIVNSGEEADITVYLSERALAVAQNSPGNAADFPSLSAGVTSSGSIEARYNLPAAGQARLALYNASGRFVKEEVNSWSSSGAHSATIDASGLPAGAYFLKLQTGEFAAVARVFLFR